MNSDGVAANTKSTKEGPELLIVDTFGFYTNPVEWVSRWQSEKQAWTIVEGVETLDSVASPKWFTFPFTKLSLYFPM